jgi:hypothetical protein
VVNKNDERDSILANDSYKASVFSLAAENELKRIQEEKLEKNKISYEIMPIGSDKIKMLSEAKLERDESSLLRKKALARILSEAVFEALPFGDEKDSYSSDFIQEAETFFLSLGCPDILLEKISPNLVDLSALILEQKEKILSEEFGTVWKEECLKTIPKSISEIKDRVFHAAEVAKLKNRKLEESLTLIEESTDSPEFIENRKKSLINRDKPSLLETMFVAIRKEANDNAKSYIDDDIVLAEALSYYALIEGANIFGLLPDNFDYLGLTKFLYNNCKK